MFVLLLLLLLLFSSVIVFVVLAVAVAVSVVITAVVDVAALAVAVNVVLAVAVAVSVMVTVFVSIVFDRATHSQTQLTSKVLAKPNAAHRHQPTNTQLSCVDKWLGSYSYASTLLCYLLVFRTTL